MAECSQTGKGITRPVLINEVLFFINTTVDQHATSQIKSTMLDFYRDDEIVAAKQALVRAVEDSDTAVAIQQFTKKRIGENKIRANIDDIMNIFETVDENMLRDSLPILCAADRSRIPVFVDEMTDIAAMRLEISKLRQQFELLTNQVLCNNKSHESINRNISAGKDNEHTVTVLRNSTLQNVIDIGKSVNDNRSCMNEEPDTANAPNQQVSGNVPHDSEDYADAVRQPPTHAIGKSVSNRDDFQLVTKKKNNKKKPVVMIGHSTGDHQFKGVAKKTVLCVSRLEIGTSTQVVEDFLKSNGVNVVSCHALTPSSTSSPDERRPKFINMRLCISQSDAKKVCNADIWPDGVVIRPWVFKGTRSTVSNAETPQLTSGC